MTSSYDSEGSLDDLRDPARGDREISLGTATILGIFLVLTLVCAVFFGFGYSLGRRSTPGYATAAENTPRNTLPGAKPSSGSPALTESESFGSTDRRPTESTDKEVPDKTARADAKNQPKPTASSQNSNASDTPAVTSRTGAERPLGAVAVPSIAPPPLNSIPAPISYVQIAAVSHRQDADLLLGALQKRGYTAMARQEPQDKLLHVQIGPLPSKKEAEALRQQLLADGYNAIVK